MLGMGIISPLMPIYATNMGASGFWLGVMYSGFALARMLAQPVTGWFSDQKGRKAIMVAGLSIYTLVSIGYGLAQNLPQLLTVRLVHGLASSMIVPIAQAYVGDICPKGKEGRMMGYFFMSMFVGIGMGPILGGTLTDAVSMNFAFGVMAALAALALLLMIVFVPRIEPLGRHSLQKPAPLSVVLKDNRVRAVCLYLASLGTLRMGIFAFLPLFIVKVLDLNVSVAGIIVSIYMFTEAFSQGFVGPIADMFPRKNLMVLGAILAPALALLIGRMGSAVSLVAVLIPVALLTNVGRIPALAYGVDAGAKYRRMGTGMGVINSAQDLGHFLGPISFGLVSDLMGIGSVFTIGAIIGLVCVPAIAYWLFQHQRQPAASFAPVGDTSEPPRS